MNVRRPRAGEPISHKCHFCGQVLPARGMMVVELDGSRRQFPLKLFIHHGCIDAWKTSSVRFQLAVRWS